LRTINGKKKEVQILAYAHARIEVLLNFVPNPRKISPFSKKKAFFSKPSAYLASWQLKNRT